MANNPMADNAALTTEPVGIGAAADAVESTVDTAEVDTDTTQAVATTEARPKAEPFDTTKAFSERLNARLDKEIADMGLQNPITGQPIRTKKELDSYKSQEKATKEAQAKGIDATINIELETLKQEIAGLKQETTIAKQDVTLSNDPKVGTVYKNNRDAIKEISESQSLDLHGATMLFLYNNQDKIIEQAKQQASNSTLAKTTAAKAASPGSLSGGGDALNNDYATMGQAEFEAMVKKAEYGELRKS